MSLANVLIGSGLAWTPWTAAWHAQARRANPVFRGRIVACSVKTNFTADPPDESWARARARAALYAAPEEARSKACWIWSPKSRKSAAARRSMKNPCFSREVLQRSSSLKIFSWSFVGFEVSSIAINKTRDSDEKAKATRTHLCPYDAVTPSLVPDNEATRSATDFAVSDESSTCSRVIGGIGPLLGDCWGVFSTDFFFGVLADFFFGGFADFFFGRVMKGGIRESGDVRVALNYCGCQWPKIRMPYIRDCHARAMCKYIMPR